MALLAFHNDPAVKAQYLSRVDAHIAADNLIRGTGWDGGKGCAVGCTLETYDHSRYPVELGIPEWLAHVEDKLFEGMSEKKSRTWPRDFLAAIRPGADLEKAKGPFLIVVLKSALETFDHAKFPDVKASIDRVIALWSHDNSSDEEFEAAAAWAEAAAWAAAARAEAAAWAAEAAARAAPRAAEAAAWAAAAEAAWAAEARAAAAWAASEERYDIFADELLCILKAV